MNIGVINESGKIENRAGLSPSGVSFLVERGHEVYLQAGAGLRSGYSNEDFIDLGAPVVFTKEEVFGRSDVVLNISPLNEEEAELVREDQILFGFHHLAVARKSLVESLLAKNVTMIGYEIIQEKDGSLPFIESLGEIAGQMCHVIAGHHLQADQGGRGLLIGSVVSVPPATAVIVGSTILARSAVRAMLGAGAHTIALGRHMDRLREIEDLTGGRAVTLMAGALIPVMLITLGVQLSGMGSVRVSLDGVLAGSVRLIAGPLLAIALAAPFGLTGIERGAGILQASMPAAVLTTLIALEHDLIPDFVTTSVLYATLASSVTLTIVLALI